MPVIRIDPTSAQDQNHHQLGLRNSAMGHTTVRPSAVGCRLMVALVAADLGRCLREQPSTGMFTI